MGPFRSWSTPKQNQAECNGSCALHCNINETASSLYDLPRNKSVKGKPAKTNYQDSDGFHNDYDGPMTITGFSRAVLSNIYEQLNRSHNPKIPGSFDDNADSTAKFVSEILTAAHRYYTIDAESTTYEVRRQLSDLVIEDEQDLLGLGSSEDEMLLETKSLGPQPQNLKMYGPGAGPRTESYGSNKALSKGDNARPSGPEAYDGYADPYSKHDSQFYSDSDGSASPKDAHHHSKPASTLPRQTSRSKQNRSARSPSPSSDEAEEYNSQLEEQLGRSYERGRPLPSGSYDASPKVSFNFNQKKQNNLDKPIPTNDDVILPKFNFNFDQKKQPGRGKPAPADSSVPLPKFNFNLDQKKPNQQSKPAMAQDSVPLPKFNFNFGPKKQSKDDGNNNALALVPSIPGEFPDELQSNDYLSQERWGTAPSNKPSKRKSRKSKFSGAITGKQHLSNKTTSPLSEALIPEGFIWHDDPKSFFDPGRVFAVLWSKPLRDMNFHTPSDFQNNDNTQVRRMITVANANGKCYCASFSTYQGQGLNAPGMTDEDVDDHIVLYSGEVPFYERNEPLLEEDPVKVYVAPGQTLHEMSRLYLARLYAVDWQTQVMNIGTIGERDTQRLKRLVRDRAEFVTEAVPDAIKATSTRRS